MIEKMDRDPGIRDPGIGIPNTTVLMAIFKIYLGSSVVHKLCARKSMVWWFYRHTSRHTMNSVTTTRGVNCQQQ